MPGHGLVKAHKNEANKTGKALLSGHLPLKASATISDSVSTTGSTSPPLSMAHLTAKLGPVKADDDDEVDLLKENMKIVDGWGTFFSYFFEYAYTQYTCRNLSLLSSAPFTVFAIFCDDTPVKSRRGRPA